MACYKHIDTSPRFLPVELSRQLLPGTFEHALNPLLDHEIDLSGFDARFCNDATGAAAYLSRQRYSRSCCSLIPKASSAAENQSSLTLRSLRQIPPAGIEKESSKPR